MATIGINVLEVEGDSTPSFVSAPLARPALIIRAERGPVNEPIWLQGTSDYRRWFGQHVPGLFGSHVTRGVVENGGRDMLCVRVTADDADPATVILQDRALAATLSVTAGTHGIEDPGDWGNSLSVTAQPNARTVTSVAAQISGANTEPFALNDGDVLDIELSGTALGSIAFNTADFPDITNATAQQIAAVVNSENTSVNAMATSDGRLRLSGQLPGFASRIVASGTATAALGLVAGNANSDAGVGGLIELAVNSTVGATEGQAVSVSLQAHVTGTPIPAAATIADGASVEVTVDGLPAEVITFSPGGAITDLANATPAEIVAYINAAASGFVAGLDSQGQIVFLTNSRGSTSSISVAAGGTDATPQLGMNGALAPIAGDIVNRTIISVDERARTLTLNAALPAGALAPMAMRLESAEFDLLVLRNGQEIERFSRLGMETGTSFYAPAVINNPASGSNFIIVEDLVSGSGPVVNLPAPISAQPLLGGLNGSVPSDADYIGEEALRTGIFALDVDDFELLAFSDTTAPAVQRAALDYAERRGTIMCIGTPPQGLDAAGAGLYADQFRARNAYGCMVWPRGLVTNPLNANGNLPTLEVPLVGHYAGMLASVANQRGSWTSPAGDKARLNILGVTHSVTDVTHTILAEDHGLSVIRSIRGSGIIADSARTLATDIQKRHVGTRLFLNFIKATLANNMDLFLQEPIDQRLCNRVSDAIRSFMLGQWQKGAFGNGPADESFRINCGIAQNPPEQTALGIFNVEVLYRSLAPAEYITVFVSQLDSATQVAET